MEPRLKSSTQWSPFPEELCRLAAQTLTERFSEEYDLEGSTFVVEGRIYEKEIVGLYGLRFKDQIKQQNFEVSMEYDSKKEKALDLIQTSMDVVDHLWTELLEDDLEDSELEKTWQTMPLKKKMYHFKYSTVNTHLEAEANRLLEDFDKKLVYGQASPETVEATDDSTDKIIH